MSIHSQTQHHALGKELDSKPYWEQKANHYSNALENDYHHHRLNVIDALIPNSLYAPGKQIFDFGCGNAIHFPAFLQAGAQISGNDISDEMIQCAQEFLSQQNLDGNTAKVGSVFDLQALPDSSLDALLSFNVLAYLTNDEERAFYEQARRLVKPGGYLIVTHSNELFDMFSLNRYTEDFFQRNFDCNAHDLLQATHLPENPVLYNIRENPMTYQYKLKQHGFQEIQQEFINYHPNPSALRTEQPKQYINTLGWPDAERWKLLFQCSTYGSCAQKA